MALRMVLRRSTRWLVALALAVVAAASHTPSVAGQDAPRSAVPRPAGWNPATHGASVKPDYPRLFSTDVVHEIRIVIPADTFKAMQADLREVVPFGGGMRLGGPAPGGVAGAGAPVPGAPAPGALPAGAPAPGAPVAPGRGGLAAQLPQLFDSVVRACSEKAAGAACSFEGTAGQCSELRAGDPLVCVPAGFGDVFVGRGAPGGPGGPGGVAGRGRGAINLTTRDPMYVPVTVHYDGKAWTKVGMRYKGNSSLAIGGATGIGKMPFRLDFDRYEKDAPEITDQRFYGFNKLTFSSNFGDDSQLREAFATEVFRDRGVPAPRAAFYRVVVDTGDGPQYWGLYTMIEDPADGAMLDTQFGGRDGNLYKPDGPGADWTHFDKEGFPKKTNEKADDFRDVESAIAALHAPKTDLNAWRAGLEATFDVDLFLRWLAVNTAIQNWDVYGALAHNYYLYGDPGQKGRLRWIPWDNNFALGSGFGGAGRGGGFAVAVPLNVGAAPPGAPPPAGGAPPGVAPAGVPFVLAGRGGPGPGGAPFQRAMFGGNDDVLHKQAGSQWPLISRLLEDEVYAARYRVWLEHAVGGLFAPDAAARRLQQLHALIAPSVVGERGERSTHTTVSSADAFARSVDGEAGLRGIIQRRHDTIRTALSAAR